MTQRLNLYLEDDFAQELRQRKPKSLSLSAFCAWMIEDHLKSLDSVARLATCSAGAGYTGNLETKAQHENEADLVSALHKNSPSTNFEKVAPLTRSKRPQGAAGGDRVGMESEEGKSKGRIWKKEFRPNLQCHADLIMQFWDTKAGAKSKAAWELLQAELTKIQERYGDQPLRAQLELGAANRWKSVTLKNYELYGIKVAPAQKPQVDWDSLDNVSFFS